MSNRQKSACAISYSYFLRDSRVRRYAEALKEYGYQVDIVSLNEVIPSSLPFSFILFPLKRRRCGMFWYFIEYPLFLLFALFYFSVNSLKKRYKLIHVFNLPDFLVFTAIIPKLLGAKIILDVRDLSPQLYQTKYKVLDKSLMVKILNFLEKYSMKFSNVILTANPLFKSLLEKKYPWINQKIGVAYECADQHIFYPSKARRNDKTINLLYIGTIEKRFAIDLIIKSLPLVLKEKPNCYLTIIPKITDEGSYFSGIKRLISRYNLGNHVDILQPLPLEQIADEIRKADIGMVLVEKDPYTDIIFRIKLYEFIACKVPLIVSRTKFLSEFFSDNQLYYLDDHSPAGLSGAILRLSANRNLRRKLAERAFIHYRRYNWGKEKNKYFRLLEEFDEK